MGTAAPGAARAATGNTPFNQRGPGDFLPNLNTIDAWLAIAISVEWPASPKPVTSVQACTEPSNPRSTSAARLFSVVI